MIKNLLRVLLVAVVFLVLAFVGLIFLVNPNQFRGAIEQAVLDNTGYHLTIAGDLDLRFSPYIGLTLNDVRLRNPASPQELASTTAISLRVDPGLLLQGELLVSEFRADDFHVNWYVDADGSNIWDVPAPNANSETATNPNSSVDVQVQSTASSNSQPSNVRAAFERIRINNASVDIQDLSLGTRYNVNELNLESRNANLTGQSFPLELDFTFLNNGISTPMAMVLRSDVGINLDTGNVDLTNINFNVTPMLLQGQLAISGLNDTLRFEGTFETNPIDVMGMLQTLGLIETSDELGSPALATQPPVSLAMAFNGNEREVNVSNFTASFADTLIQANAGINFANALAPTVINYNLSSNAIDLTPFMSQEEADSAEIVDTDLTEESEDAPAVAVTPPAIDTPLPLELLNSINLLGSIAIESVTARNMVFSDINLFTNLEDGVLDIESGPINAFDGTILGNLRLDARGNAAALTSQISVNQVNVADVSATVSSLNSVTGRLNLEGEYTGAGTTVNQLRDSLAGPTSFAITENTVDIGVIKQVFTAITALSTTLSNSGDSVQQWPDIIRFQELSGYILLEQGIASNQQLNLRMDNFDLSGTGGIDLDASSFDYDLSITLLGEPSVQTIPIDTRYHDVSWPVRCSSAFDDSVTQYCRPDFAQVRQIFAQMGTNEVRRRVQDAVTDQVPDTLQERARGLLRNILN